MKPLPPNGPSPSKVANFAKFTYYDNRESPPKRLLIVHAHGILAADELFNAWSKLNVVKSPFIGCRVNEA